VPGPDGRPRTASNRSGGVQGGISNGEPVVLRVAFKPTATIAQAQATVDRAGRATVLEARGRHDPCVLPRAVPIVEAMVALVLADALVERFGGDSIADLERAMASSNDAVRARFRSR
jgi:chorismate synthase